MIRTFDAAMHAEMRRVLPLAEELCGDHFQLSAFDLRSAPYDIATAEQLIAEGLEPPPQPSKLAELRRCELTREERSARDRRRTHYRICLWDPHILTLCDDGARPGAVLLYVLIHELVHVVRFARQLALFDASPAARVREEQAVHQTSAQILDRAREAGLDALRQQAPELGACLQALERD